MDTARARRLVVGVTDIFFVSRIEAACAAAPALDPVFAQPGDSLSRLCAVWQPCVLILDLQDPVLDPLGEVGRIKSGPLRERVEILGFLPHVRMDLRESAEKAGVDRIMVRSAFTRKLPQILAGVISGTAP
ncbi:MAG TPA: hypothetical protein VMS93_11185 [Candidatus Saccharimonadales bacterium]|nr:hypothetical protein [Candidatus Saccharimonadales bacterium]